MTARTDRRGLLWAILIVLAIANTASAIISAFTGNWTDFAISTTIAIACAWAVTE